MCVCAHVFTDISFKRELEGRFSVNSDPVVWFVLTVWQVGCYFLLCHGTHSPENLCSASGPTQACTVRASVSLRILLSRLGPFSAPLLGCFPNPPCLELCRGPPAGSS